ncbi:UPAR/Ly6 domain-containing protein crok [Megalopta genalis]|uniref:UPAR/Ly6 domain-containing protein crok n=1 Tax=Megalopta genalis TaxID=115081 RepID=UPI0014432399|nr:uncharacterized protein LOC117228783 [Megalopta genalis]
MSPRTEWMLVIFGLVVFAQSGSALKCWVCASNASPLCGDPMNITEHQTTFHTKVCESGIYDASKPICRKIVKRENGDRVVIRQCSTPNVDEASITDGPCSSMAIAGTNVIESCHICSTDLCNSAPSASILHSLYIVALAFVGYHFFQTKYNVV